VFEPRTGADKLQASEVEDMSPQCNEQISASYWRRERRARFGANAEKSATPPLEDAPMDKLQLPFHPP
jgi:hypothetical protein